MGATMYSGRGLNGEKKGAEREESAKKDKEEGLENGGKEPPKGI